MSTLTAINTESPAEAKTQLLEKAKTLYGTLLRVTRQNNDDDKEEIAEMRVRLNQLLVRIAMICIAQNKKENPGYLVAFNILERTKISFNGSAIQVKITWESTGELYTIIFNKGDLSDIQVVITETGEVKPVASSQGVKNVE